MAGSATARKIAEAARELLHAEGSDAVTVRQVARAAGITPMAVYRHFPDRAGLLNALAAEGFASLTARLKRVPAEGDLAGRIEQTMDIYLRHALRRPRLFELMFLQPRAGARKFPHDFRAGRSPTANLAAQLIEEGMASGFLRRDDAWEVAFEMGALWQGLAALYIGGRMRMTQTAFREFCKRALWRHLDGIRA